MRYILSLLVFFISFSIAAQSGDLPFQVLIAKDASIYGEPVQPLQLVDDVTSIEVKEGGFLSLVHQGGSTYEHTEKIFTFYLKPEELKNRKERPQLDILYADSAIVDQTKTISVLYPVFDRSGYLEWNQEEPFELYWHMKDDPITSFKLQVSDNSGNKIQDFPTSLHTYQLKPNTYGLKDGTFIFKISISFAGETIESKTHTVQLKSAPMYEKKATDLILKALELEFQPELALPSWQQALEKPNGKFYADLYQKFLIRNKTKLRAAGQDVEQLLSQNK